MDVALSNRSFLPTYSLSVVAVITALLMCNEYQDGFVCYIDWKMAYKSIQDHSLSMECEK